ncbi:DUF2997 domain-containing protein [Arthrobacter sp. CAU 1506]|uniref:DUF2997 domain-containing protein n=1 Tax=Arthrobacter sp. CAU 1506 TaxID=2560052 RepID=UPI0010AC8134|nr:DUF2997 domain-containing protein [Arthrobacter sp. CAU 1506]TJY72490.1 DUF2997 domain-containing protein [Arthrobacter sp. CAU 1506]
MDQQQLIVMVGPDGTVAAETKNIFGSDCLDYITLLEDLLEAETVSSSYTADYARTAVTASDYVSNESTE